MQEVGLLNLVLYFNSIKVYNSYMNSKMISLGRKHLPLNSGWTCSRPQYKFAIELDSGGSVK